MSDVADRANRARDTVEEQGGLDPLNELQEEDERFWGIPQGDVGTSRTRPDLLDDLEDLDEEEDQFAEPGESDEPDAYSSRADEFGTVGDDY